MRESIIFTAGCLVINGVTDCLALHFLLGISQTKKSATHSICSNTSTAHNSKTEFTMAAKCYWHYILLWLSLGSILTLLAIRFQFPGMLALHMLFLLTFARGFVNIAVADMAAPVIILFTLYTFMEGFSAIFMSWLSVNIELSFSGMYIQLLLSLVLAFLFFLALRLIRTKYAFTLRSPLSSCLYLLLLPCALIVLLIRYSLRLDSALLGDYLSKFSTSASRTALLGMATAVILFFLILHLFCKIIRLTEQEQTAALLAEQVRGEQRYIEEARKRNEQYTSLRHDLNNHLLVLSGLLDEQKYREAKNYAHILRKNSLPQSAPAATGRAALDILLNEKLNRAEQDGIQTFCQVQLPPSIDVNDMELCIIFSNMLDNALAACRNSQAPEKKLSITAKTRSQLLFIECVNTAPPRRTVKPGTGLGNIQRVAEKYQGTVEIENTDGLFRISVLLCPAH